MDMFSTQKPAPTPAQPPAVRIPGPNDPDVVAARKKKLDEEFGDRRGRDSTRLASREGSDTAYTRTTLG